MNPSGSSPKQHTATFGGSVPRSYHTHLVPMLFESYADDLVDRVGPVERGAVLETAAGTGVVTERLRARLPASTSLTATDVNADMLAVHRNATAHQTGVTLRTADATALPFEDETFDAVVCQFGVMFFPDEAGGCREAARVLRRGGRYLFNVWDDLAHNPIVACIHETLLGLAPNDPPRFLEKPFRALDLTAIVRMLEQAGFEQARATVLRHPCRVASARQAALALLTGSPLAPQLVERGLAERALPAVTDALEARFGGSADGAIEAPMQAVVFEAVKG